MARASAPCVWISAGGRGCRLSRASLKSIRARASLTHSTMGGSIREEQVSEWAAATGHFSAKAAALASQVDDDSVPTPAPQDSGNRSELAPDFDTLIWGRA